MPLSIAYIFLGVGGIIASMTGFLPIVILAIIGMILLATYRTHHRNKTHKRLKALFYKL